MQKKKYQKQTIPYLILFVVMIGVLLFYNLSLYKVNTFTYDEFIVELSKEKVKNIEITPKNSAGIYLISGQLKGYAETESFKVNVPMSESVLEKILTYVDESGVEVITKTNPENNGFLMVLLNIVPYIILIGGTIFLFSKIGGNNKNSMDFGRSKAKLSEDGGSTKFSDVAG